MRPGVGKIRVLTVCNKGDMGFWHSLIYSMIDNADCEDVIRYPFTGLVEKNSHPAQPFYSSIISIKCSS